MVRRERWVSAIALAFIVGGCQESGAPGVAIDDVASSVRANYQPFVAIALDVDLGPLKPGTDSWGIQVLGLRGRQTEWTSTLTLPSGSLLVTDTEISALDDQSQTLELWYGDEVEVTLLVGPSEPLSPGLHQLLLELPLTLHRVDGEPIEPIIGSAQLSLRYRVMDPSRNKQTLAFCDRVVPVLDGLLPTPATLETVRTDAEASLGPVEAFEIRQEAAALADRVIAHHDNPYNGVDTSGLVRLVMEICNVEMFSVTAAA